MNHPQFYRSVFQQRQSPWISPVLPSCSQLPSFWSSLRLDNRLVETCATVQKRRLYSNAARVACLFQTVPSVDVNSWTGDVHLDGPAFPLMAHPSFPSSCPAPKTVVETDATILGVVHSMTAVPTVDRNPAAWSNVVKSRLVVGNLDTSALRPCSTLATHIRNASLFFIRVSAWSPAMSW